jgi:heptaprenyl diphosphate synthase
MFPIAERMANVGIGYTHAQGLPRPRPLDDLLESFLNDLRTYHADRLGELEAAGRPMGAPVGINFSAEKCELDGVVFIGDAARTTDPLTGEGIDQAMRSAHATALALHGAIKRKAGPRAIGDTIARGNVRLGQDSAMAARVVHQLLTRRDQAPANAADILSAPAPLFSLAGAMLTAETNYPDVRQTLAGSLAARLTCDEALLAVDDRARRSLGTRFIFARELLHREICAGMGPVDALVLMASRLSAGGEPDDSSVDAALCIELLGAFPKMLTHFVESTETSQGKANNAFALMIGDYALSRALTASSGLGPQYAGALGEAIESASEGVALLMQDQFDVQRTPERYLRAATLTRGASVRLAVTWGAQLTGATAEDSSPLALYGTNLGIALQICDDIAGLLEADPVSGRKPRHILRDGNYTLPVLYAIQEDANLADALTHTDTTGLDNAVKRIQGGNGRASEECRRFVARAETALANVPHDPQPLQAICELVTWRLASLTQRALDSAATRNGEIAPPRPIGRTTVSGT